MAQFNLSIINDTQGNLQVKDFEQVKNELVALIDDEFQTPSVIDNSNYMIAKDQRAKLNKVSKLLTEQKNRHTKESVRDGLKPPKPKLRNLLVSQAIDPICLMT